MAADGGLRLLLLGPDHRANAFLARADPGVAAEEVDRARAEAEQLGHPGVVVARGGQMAIRAILGRADAAGGVREMRVERLAAIALRRDGLLLRIHPFAVRVLRTDDHRARRTQHGHAVILHRAVDAEHEHVVTHDLRVVRGEIAVRRALELVERHRAWLAFIGRWQPKQLVAQRRMAHLAGDGLVVVRELDVALLRCRRARRPTSCRRGGASSRRRCGRCTCGEVGSTVSTVCGTSQRLLGSMVEYC